jgi:sporulation protein YlmC with PRC-barrel domain
VAGPDAREKERGPVTTRLASTIEGRPLTGRNGVALGVVEHLLYHPSEPCVIGAVVRPPAAMVVVKRPETFLPLSALRYEDGAVAADLAKLPSQRAAAKPLGFNPDLTVIWTGMPVSGPSGGRIGTVSDVEFDSDTGGVSRMEVAGGAVADAAHGRFLVPGGSIVGYSTGAVRIGVESGGLEATGGLAKAAARTVAATSASVNALGEAVGDTVVAACGGVGRAIRVVAGSQVTQKAAKRLTGTWRDSVKSFREGMKGDE